MYLKEKKREEEHQKFITKEVQKKGFQCQLIIENVII